MNNEQDTSSDKGEISFVVFIALFIQLTFVELRLFVFTEWSWGWVLSPTWLLGNLFLAGWVSVKIMELFESNETGE